MNEESRAPRYLVLIGPPGSGKTHLGKLLAQRLGFDFVEGELLLLLRYGSTEGFVKHKAEALTWYYRELRARLGASGAWVVFETTGLSDREHLLRLMDERSCVLVRVSASRERCVERVAARERGRNFSNEGAGEFHDFWMRQVQPQYDYGLVLDNDGTPEDDLVAQVADVISGASRGPGSGDRARGH